MVEPTYLMVKDSGVQIANLIVARNFIDANINSQTIAREEVGKLQSLIKKIDRKIIDLLLSDDFLS
jgi:hypothetical protein